MTDRNDPNDPRLDLDDDVDAQQQADREPNPANAEAAKYRRRLRDTEAQLAAATTQLAEYQRAAVLAHLAGVLDEPADLFDIGGHQLADYLDDDGRLDTAALDADAQQLIDNRPKLRKARDWEGKRWGQHSDKIPRFGNTTSWSEVLHTQ